ncbi:MAG: dienelactone hydrolase family protein [Candidatus Neomarinimicrobiota bacterium]
MITLFSCDNKKTSNSSSLSRTEANNLRDKLFTSYLSEIKAKRIDENNDKVIKINDLELKYEIKFFGEKPINGWELYFSLHGGGGVADEYNESLWSRHKSLYELEQGILLTPRSPTNTWNMWHQDHIDTFFNKLIQNMIAFYDVDPNKIYIMGYSAGGDGVYQLAPRMADRFAAASMMAGHPNDANPLGLRNIGFTLHMGENDSLYNRNKVALEWKEKLSILRKSDPEFYIHQVKIYEGKGHQITHAKVKGLVKQQIDGLDSSGISWISNFTRNPYPKKVVWMQDDVMHNRFYWLKVNKPQINSLIIASINNQTITIEKTTLTDLIIRLNDEMIDMDKKVIVKYLDTEIFNGIVHRNKKTILNSIEEYGDPKSIYFGEISISL